jgi:hypothetical protein
MRTLIRNRDLKTLFSGVAVAAAVGLLMGGVMYPKLNLDKIEGPQILLGGGGARSTAEASYAGIGAYNGRIPDYVIGTDALKPPQYEVMAYQERAAPERANTGEAADVMAYEQPAEIRATRWEDEPREAPLYPSEHGNTAYETDLPAPPEPPTADDERAIPG